LYTIPPLLHLPVMQTIALSQHLLGLVLVVIVGFLVAYSFKLWRIWIIPVTVLIAINPTLLWYEHVMLPEFLYAFFVVTTALAGLLFYKAPDDFKFRALVTSLFLTAAARPEGKFFWLFGLALIVVAYWPDKAVLRRKAMTILVFTILSFVLNRTYQSGSLLYSNIAHLTPRKLWTAPGFAEKNASYFANLRERWKVVPT